MSRGAPRLPRELIDAVDGLDDPGNSIAETWRRLCGAADLIGVPRPSYEHVRRLVHDARRRAGLRGSGELLVDVLGRTRTATGALDEHMRRSTDRRVAAQVHHDRHAWRQSGAEPDVGHPPAS